MARSVELGDDPYAALPGVAQDLHEVGMRIVTVAGRGGVITVERAAVRRLEGVRLRDGAVFQQFRYAPERSVGGQLREPVHFNPPSFVIAEVQVQAVDLVVREDVDEAEKVVLAGEVAADVQHQAAVLEVGPVDDDGVGDGSSPRVAAYVVQGDGGIECSVLIGRLDLDLAVEGDAVPARDLALHEHRRGGVSEDRGPSGDSLYLLRARYHIEDGSLVMAVLERLQVLRRKVFVLDFQSHGLLPFLLEEKTFGRAAAVHQRLGVVFEGEDPVAVVGSGNDPVQGAAYVLDGALGAFVHRDRGAELAEPKGPAGSRRGIHDFKDVGCGALFRVGVAFGPDDLAGRSARGAYRARA